MQGKLSEDSNISPMTNGLLFEEEWTVLRPRLLRLLAKRGASPDLAEDIAQETALRLLKKWERVNLRMPLWPYVSRIALNALIDHHRAKDFDAIEELPEAADPYDLEEQSAARARLSAVWQAMESLSPRERGSLLAEVGFAPRLRDSSATKMARLRARRKLNAAMEKAGAFFGLPLAWRRANAWFQMHFPSHVIDATAAAGIVAIAAVVGSTLQVPMPGDSQGSRQAVRHPSIEQIRAETPAMRGLRTKPAHPPRFEQPAPHPSGTTSSADGADLAPDAPTTSAEVGAARAQTGRREGMTYIKVCTGEKTDTPYDDTDATIVLYDPEPDDDDDPPPSCRHGH